MLAKENYHIFIDSLYDILEMGEERSLFIRIFVNSVWDLTHTDSPEFSILSDLAYYFHTTGDDMHSDIYEDTIRASIRGIKLCLAKAI